MRNRQKPGKRWTFVYKPTGEKDEGTLPSRRGKSNDFAFWMLHSWGSRKFHRIICQRRNKGIGPQKLLGRMKSLLEHSRKTSRGRGELPLSVTPEYLLQKWKEQHNVCAACKGPVDLMDAVAHHCHNSGKFYGFIHKHCNWIEGHMKKMSKNQVKFFTLWILKNRS